MIAQEYFGVTLDLATNSARRGSSQPSIVIQSADLRDSWQSSRKSVRDMRPSTEGILCEVDDHAERYSRVSGVVLQRAKKRAKVVTCSSSNLSCDYRIFHQMHDACLRVFHGEVQKTEG